MNRPLNRSKTKPLFPSLPQNFSLNGWRKPDLWFGLYFLLLLSATTFSTTFSAKFIQAPFFRHLGLLSYSIYLFHMLFIQILQHMGLKNERLFIAVLAISWVVSLITYLSIEKPFLKFKPKNQQFQPQQNL